MATCSFSASVQAMSPQSTRFDHRIKHVIYVIKENRTYDQILGDLDRGNGDPQLTEFGEKNTPNFHHLAQQFVDLDNFFDSGDVSGDGWLWSTAGREPDFARRLGHFSTPARVQP